MEEICSEKDIKLRQENMRMAQAECREMLQDSKMYEKFEDFICSKSEKNAMTKSMVNYIRHVDTLLQFIKASRLKDWELHLKAGEKLTGLFFAMDRLKYKRLWPRYISDMQALEKEDPKIWNAFIEGDFAVTKTDIPFVSIGPDHACEQENREIKQDRGLSGITQNSNARDRFFLAGPQLSRISKEYKAQFQEEIKRTVHHGLTGAAVRRDHASVEMLKDTMLSFINPFTVQDDESLVNIITHAKICPEAVHDILNIDSIGQMKYEEFVRERFEGNVSLWAPVKRVKLKGYTSVQVQQSNKKAGISDLKESRSLFGRLMVIANSNRDIDQSNAIGQYEFSSKPRSLFGADGSLLPCLDKSKLIHHLKGLTNDTHSQEEPEEESAFHLSKKVAIIDGMAVLHKLKKPPAVKNMRELADHFIQAVQAMSRDFEEVHLVFDVYKDQSLKSSTRDRRRGSGKEIAYKVADQTQVSNVTMQRLLSSSQTKQDLTEYLCTKAVSAFSQKILYGSAGGKTFCSSGSDQPFATNNHEEADTLIIWHATLVASDDVMEICVFADDTDILVLLLAHFSHLSPNVYMYMKSGKVCIKDIHAAIGPGKAKALLGFHTFTGCDTTGRFAGKSKITWLRHFLNMDQATIEAFYALGSEEELSGETEAALQSFVCKGYCPAGVSITSLKDLRWYLFCKYQSEGEHLPPTTAALHEHTLCAHVQAFIWHQAHLPHQTHLDPTQNGWHQQESDFRPIATKLKPAPQAVMELVKCSCSKSNCSTSKCSCKGKGLTCTAVCLCQDCENEDPGNVIIDDDNDND